MAAFQYQSRILLVLLPIVAFVTASITTATSSSCVSSADACRSSCNPSCGSSLTHRTTTTSSGRTRKRPRHYSSPRRQSTSLCPTLIPPRARRRSAKLQLRQSPYWQGAGCPLLPTMWGISDDQAREIPHALSCTSFDEDREKRGENFNVGGAKHKIGDGRGLRLRQNRHGQEEEVLVAKKQGHPNRRRVGDIINASLLIAGTTVGGGFLAIPTVVQPVGFVPSAVGMTGVWMYFVLQSFVMTDCISNARRRRGKNGTTVEEGNQQVNPPDEDDDTENDRYEYYDEDYDHPGIAATAKSVWGPRGEVFVGLLLSILTEATLVSQISRGGSLLFSPKHYRWGCAIVSLSVSAVVFGPRRGLDISSKINSFLTVIFVIASVLLFTRGSPAVADWSVFLSSGGGSKSKWAGLPRAIPTFLQLLVYVEVLPSVCRLLQYDTSSIRTAILVGSFLPLVFEVGWAGLGIALAPPSPKSVAGSMDPVTTLLSSAFGNPVWLPLFVLAVTAILTTIIGSYLALQSIFDDLVPTHDSNTGKMDEEASLAPDASSVSSPREQEVLRRRRRRWLSAATIVTPALIIASISPDLFLRAIDFAGSYPVLILSGIIPPSISLQQHRWHQRHDQRRDARQEAIGGEEGNPLSSASSAASCSKKKYSGFSSRWSWWKRAEQFTGTTTKKNGLPVLATSLLVVSVILVAYNGISDILSLARRATLILR